MLGIQNYGGFIMAVALFQIVPGAGTITILSATAKRGVGGGMKAVCGTLSGDFIYMSAAVLGLAAMLSAYPGVLAGVQWVGVGYLVWMGFTLLRLPVPERPVDGTDIPDRWAGFKQGLAVSLTNPKVILFFMAFFPLFLNAESTPLALLVLMGHVTAISFLYQTGLVLVGHAVIGRIARWRFARLLAARLAGAALIGFGVKLALQR